MKKDWDLVTKYLISFLQKEVKKTGLKKAVIGLSGGIDSAVVAVLCQKAFGEDFLSVMLPSQFSSKGSIDDALELVEKFDIKHEIVSIEPLLNAYIDSMDKSNLRVGNFSARMRMSILYDISARESALVIGTSNKSELMLGYGTMFGDLASAINPIGDIYKSEIFEYASYLGVNEAIISKPPSADLWENQSDEDDLGYSYAQIDEVLKELIDNRKSINELLNQGFDKSLIDMIDKRVFQNQFKRKLPLIAKLTSRTINQDFLYPRDIRL
jgi:NAD+ synthase